MTPFPVMKYTPTHFNINDPLCNCYYIEDLYDFLSGNTYLFPNDFHFFH